MKKTKALLALSLVGLTLLTACSKISVEQPKNDVTTTADITLTTETPPEPANEDIVNFNAFLTELSQYRMGNFNGSTDYPKALSFAFTYALDKNILQTVDDFFSLNYEDANKITQQFFGITLPKSNIEDYTFSNEKYFTPAGAGETVGGVSITREYTRKADGTFSITAEVFFYAEPHPGIDEYEDAITGITTRSLEDMKVNTAWEYGYSVVAEVKKNDNGTFTLLTYKIVEE